MSRRFGNYKERDESMGQDFLNPLLHHLQTSTSCTPQFASWMESQILLLSQEHEVEKELLMDAILSFQPEWFCKELKGYGLHLQSGSTWCSRHCEAQAPNTSCAYKWLEVQKKKINK